MRRVPELDRLEFNDPLSKLYRTKAKVLILISLCRSVGFGE